MEITSLQKSIWKLEDGLKPAGSIDHMGNPELPHVSNRFHLLGKIEDVSLWKNTKWNIL